VKKLKNGKAAGLTGVPAEASRAMCNANLLHIHKHVNDFFVGTADLEQWQSESMCVSTKKRQPFGPKQTAWHHTNGIFEVLQF
jgi:hypothetical protein